MASVLGRIPGPARIVAVTALAVAVAVGAIAVVRSVWPRPAPLVDDTAQAGALYCAPAPNKPDVPRWNTAIGFVDNYFYNRSGRPLTVESVSLIDPHNAVLRGAMVFEMAHSRAALVNGGAFADKPAGITPAVWRMRNQPVHGAIIEPGGVAQPLLSRRGNAYQVRLGISARTPRGAWAAGFRLTYWAQGRTYTVSAYVGYAITPNDSEDARCDGLLQGIQNSWAAAKVN